jgi:hypothetical protein
MDQSADTPKKKLVQRLEHLRQERQSFVTHWQELADNIAPHTFRKQVSDRNKGDKKNQHIVDNTATLALRTLGSGMMAGLTSPARPWFKLAANEIATTINEAAKMWLADVEMRMREVFVRSNLYQVLPIVYASLGCYGTAAMLELEDEEDVVRFYPLPTGSYMAANSHRQQVNTVFREFSMTVQQLADEFGVDNLSDTIRAAYDANNRDNWVNVVHAIMPNPEREPGKIDNKNKPYASWYFEANSGDDKFLRQTGYEEFPAMVPRWSVTGEDVYGYGPAMDALGDIKMLQLEQSRKLQAIDKMVNPPMLGDASLRNQRTSMLPGDITYISGLANTSHAGFRPVYEVNPRIAELSGDIDEVQRRIRRTLYEDMMQMFAMSDSSQMTAREVEERHQEKLLVLGPVMERLNDELLDPIIDRTFAIMLRKGLIPPPPTALEGEALRVEYISIMAQAQKLIGTASIERLVSFVGNLAGVTPAVLDKIDFDEAVDEYGSMLGVSPKVVISADKVADKRAARAKAEQDKVMADRMTQAAGAAKLLSETGVGESTALNRLLGS